MMKKNKECKTLVFIFVLILVRIMFASTENIMIIVFLINIVSLLFVCWAMEAKVQSTITCKIKNGSNNKILGRRNKEMKGLLIKYIYVSIGCIVLLGIIVFLIFGEAGLSVYNDIIALLALGISIEDDIICEKIIKKVKKS